MDVFGRDGYVGARVEDIAALAGATRSTFYLHFRSKLDVVREVMVPLRQESEELYRRLDAIPEPGWAELHGWLVEVAGHWRRNRAAISVVNQAVAVEPELAAYPVEGAEAGAGALKNLLERRPPLQREATRLRVTMFVLQLERVCSFWLLQNMAFGEQETLAALTDSLYTVLYPRRDVLLPRRAASAPGRVR